MSKLNINEEEKARIRGLHRMQVINEQSTEEPEANWYEDEIYETYIKNNIKDILYREILEVCQDMFNDNSLLNK